jgi:hypothetical protein
MFMSLRTGHAAYAKLLMRTSEIGVGAGVTIYFKGLKYRFLSVDDVIKLSRLLLYAACTFLLGGISSRSPERADPNSFGRKLHA